MTNVVKLELTDIGSTFRFDADEVLERAKGQGFTTLVILGETEDGAEYFIDGNANAGEALMLMERCKLQLIDG